MNTVLNSINILVTRPKQQGLSLIKLIEQHGGTAINFPTLEIIPLINNQQIKTKLEYLADYQWHIFISANAVNFALQANNGKIESFKQAKIAAIGKATAKALEEAGLIADLIPEIGFNSEALLAMPPMQSLKNKKFLIIRGEGGRETLAQTLKERGATVDYLEVYKRVQPKADNSAILALLAEKKIQAITITSGEALHNLIAMLGNEIQATLFNIPLIVISERIKQIAQDLGFKQVHVSASPADTAIIKTVTTVCNGEDSGRRSN
ncbi:MAG: uroporphyrinogen-III synthase [Methylococcaceae bacterium]|nr:uroporphyrinogen-III synthase [Methylococcaceae bacterium]